MVTNCVFLGHNAGRGITDADGLVIIGDNIRDMDIGNPDLIFIVPGKLAVGRTLFDEQDKILKEALKKKCAGMWGAFRMRRGHES